MSEAQDLDRGIKAKALLENKLFDESFELVKASLFKQIEALPLADKDGLEDLHKCLKLLNSVKANLISALNNGKVAEFRRKEEERKRLGAPVKNLRGYY